MVRAAAVALVVALAGGCSEASATIEWFRPSDRLAVRVWASDDGYRYAFGWHDRMLDVTCAADAPACAPRVAAYFEDASCRQIIAASADPLPAYASYIDGFNHEGHGLVIDEPFTGPVYAGWRGCVLAGETVPGFHYARALPFPGVLVPGLVERVGGLRYAYPDLAYVALADPAAVAEAIGTSRVHVEGGETRLRTRYLLDADTPLAFGIVDAELATPCTPAPDPTGQLRCLPPLSVPLYREAFADAACTQPLPAPVYLTPGVAATADGYARIDQPVAGAVFVRAGALCLPSGVRDPLWQSGAALAADAFVALAIDEVEGD